MVVKGRLKDRVYGTHFLYNMWSRGVETLVFIAEKNSKIESYNPTP